MYKLNNRYSYYKELLYRVVNWVFKGNVWILKWW